MVRAVLREIAWKPGSAAGTRGALSQGRRAAMAINGVVTSREVVRYAGLIVREFGTSAWLRCCAAIVLRRRTTFLDCVFH